MCEQCERNPAIVWEPIHDVLPVFAVYEVTPTRETLKGRVFYSKARPGWVNDRNKSLTFATIFSCTDNLVAN